MLQKVENKHRYKDSPIWKKLCIDDNMWTVDWRLGEPKFYNLCQIKLINWLSSIVNVILETFLRFKCTPIEIAQESFKETFSRLSCKNNARDTKFFYKKFYKPLMWWMIIGKWKSDINDKPRWKPIRSWTHQHFVKIL